MKTYSEVIYAVRNRIALYGTSEYMFAVLDQYKRVIPLCEGESQEYWKDQQKLVLEWMYKGMPL